MTFPAHSDFHRLHSDFRIIKLMGITVSLSDSRRNGTNIFKCFMVNKVNLSCFQDSNLWDFFLVPKCSRIRVWRGNHSGELKKKSENNLNVIKSNIFQGEIYRIS